MKAKILIIMAILIFELASLHSQNIDLNKENLEEINVFMSFKNIDGDDVVRVIKDSAIKEFDEPTFVKIKDIDFTKGNIEMKVMSRLLADAPESREDLLG